VLELEGRFGFGDADAGYWDAALFEDADGLDVVFAAYGYWGSDWAF
jgi:hypothetical protein